MAPSRTQLSLAAIASVLLYRYLSAQHRRQPCKPHNSRYCTTCYSPIELITVPSTTRLRSTQGATSIVEYLLIRALPLAFQTRIRDSGYFSSIVDTLTIIGGFIFFLLKPWLFVKFLSTHNIQHNVQYSKQSKRLYCDVYHHGTTDAVPVDSTAATTATNSNSNQLHLRSGQTVSLIKLKPVIVFVHGGAWSSGSKYLYRLYGHFLRDAGYVTVIPNYRVFPFVKLADDQANDISACVSWVHQNIHQYGGDGQQIFMAGHSSGGHIISLMYFRWLANKTVAQHPPIRGLIPIAAPFNIAAHYAFEQGRGVHEISPMKPANGDLANFANYSPDELAAAFSPQQVEQLPPVLLIHGNKDMTVPPSSSQRFAEALIQAGAAKERIKLYLLKRADHVTPILDCMVDGESKPPQIRIINQFTERWKDGVTTADISNSKTNAQPRQLTAKI